jgi:hypothetical protein
VIAPPACPALYLHNSDQNRFSVRWPSCIRPLNATKDKGNAHLSPPTGVNRFRPEAATVPSVNQATPRPLSAIPQSTSDISLSMTRTPAMGACLALEPALRPGIDELAGGIFTASEQVGDCAAFCAGVTARLKRQRNLEWLLGTEVIGQVRSGGRLVAIAQTSPAAPAAKFRISGCTADHIVADVVSGPGAVQAARAAAGQ